MAKKTTKSNAEAGEFRSGPIAGTKIVSGINFKNKGLQYADVDGIAVFEGDIILGTTAEIQRAQDPTNPVLQSVGITGQQFRWPNATIPYDIESSMPNQQRITDAIAHWEANTRIRFVLRTTANAGSYPDYVHFTSGDGCSSYVGMQGGKQDLTLGSSCSTGNAIHEIGHAVGLWHEQSREDRDMFVQIVWDNIDPSRQHNFNQHIADGDDLGTYDYGSIMHYPTTAFSTNGQATIIPLQPIPAGVVVGQRNGLSQGDINGVHIMYPPVLKLPIKEAGKDPISDTFKEVGKDPLSDTATIKEINKDPIFDTFKEVRKDPITDPTIKEGAFDPGTLVENIGILQPPVTPFILATPHQYNAGQQVNPGTAAATQAQQLTQLVALADQHLAELYTINKSIMQMLGMTTNQQNL